MSEQRINTVLTEEETIKALKNQLNESEYKLLEKTLKDYANGDDTENPLEIPIDYSGVEEGQHIDYDAMVDRYAKLKFRLSRMFLFPAILIRLTVCRGILCSGLFITLKVHITSQRNSIRFQRKYSDVFISKIGVLNRTPLNLKSPMNSGRFYPLNKIYKQDI